MMTPEAHRQNCLLAILDLHMVSISAKGQVCKLRWLHHRATADVQFRGRLSVNPVRTQSWINILSDTYLFWLGTVSPCLFPIIITGTISNWKLGISSGRIFSQNVRIGKFSTSYIPVFDSATAQNVGYHVWKLHELDSSSNSIIYFFKNSPDSFQLCIVQLVEPSCKWYREFPSWRICAIEI